MGSFFTPASDSIHLDIIHRCFRLLDVEQTHQGDVVGVSLHLGSSVTWSKKDILVTVETPKRYASDPRPRNWPGLHKEVRSWPFKGATWKRTTGFLNLSRIVPHEAASFEWIEPTRLAQGFEIPFSPCTSRSAEACLANFWGQENWMRPTLRSDWSFDYERTSTTDPDAIRIATLFEVSGKQIVLWEIQNSTALRLFSHQPGFHAGDMVVNFAKREHSSCLETLTYEFQLNDSDTYDFKIAKPPKNAQH